MNRHQLAVNVTLKEGLKVSQNVGQIKEALRVAFEEMAGLSDEAILRLVRGTKKRGARNAERGMKKRKGI